MSRVYCSVYNGLGNQLFGYALGRYLSKKHNKELHVDLTKLNVINFLSKVGVKKDTPREFELDKLGFVHPIKKFNYLEFARKYSLYSKSRCHVADYRKTHPPHEDISNEHKIYSIGWGEFDIVQEILPELRENLSPNFPHTEHFNHALSLIKAKNPVAIHIRRTDYLNDRTGRRFNGICTEQYYENAIELVRNQTEKPFFMIFTDDPEYVKAHFKLENSYLVNGNTGYADLYLMSLCKNFILANSTFSFWGAMLSKSEDKLVCIPEYWYNRPLENEPYLPVNWLKIPIS